MRFTRNEIILAMRFRIAVVARRAREPSFISATPFDADGSAGGAAWRGTTVAIMHLQGMRGSMMAPQDNPSACLDP
jgi:NO-binding membrane sensor protein with MHYT domain